MTDFGSYNPVGEAEAEPEGLHMQKNHQAMKYFVMFMQLASCVQWGEAALLCQAYHGLTGRIKDNMVHHEKLCTLSALCKLALSINPHYWE